MSSISIVMKIYFPGPRNHIFLGSGRPRGPQKPFQNAGRFEPRRLDKFLGPPEPSRPQTSIISGSRKKQFS